MQTQRNMLSFGSGWPRGGRTKIVPTPRTGVRAQQVRSREKKREVPLQLRFQIEMLTVA
jgi:hypothetical protein